MKTLPACKELSVPVLGIAFWCCGGWADGLGVKWDWNGFPGWRLCACAAMAHGFTE